MEFKSRFKVWHGKITDVKLFPSHQHFFILTNEGALYLYCLDGELRGTIPVENGATQVQVDPSGTYVLILSARDTKLTLYSVKGGIAMTVLSETMREISSFEFGKEG